MIYIVFFIIFISLFIYSLSIRKTLLNYDFKNKQKKRIKLYFIGVDWCPSCQKLLEIWKRLEKHYKNRSDMEIFRIDATHQDFREYRITGYPTIILKVNRKKYYYKGFRSFDNLIDFIDKYSKT